MNTSELTDSKVLCGVDTIEIQSDTESGADLSSLAYVHNNAQERIADSRYRYVVNPDTAHGERGIYCMSLYSETLDKMICEMQLTRPTKTRLDFRFDRFGSGTYDKLLKLNTALIMLVGLRYKCKNRYLSIDMLTGENLTARIQNRYFEMEFYHKALQQPNGTVDSRLELRSKGIEDGADERAELDYWFDKRFRKSVSREQYADLQEILNFYLWERYEAEKAENPNLKTNEFLHKHRMRILTKSQLTDFYHRLAYANPSASAREYIRTKHLETVNYALIETYIRQLRTAADLFLNS